MKLYADRDIEAQGQVYFDHVAAMTVESLHSKSHIAAELAHRDLRIAELEEINARLSLACKAYSKAMDEITRHVKKLRNEP